jgi:hypothetical protein
MNPPLMKSTNGNALEHQREGIGNENQNSAISQVKRYALVLVDVAMDNRRAFNRFHQEGVAERYLRHVSLTARMIATKMRAPTNLSVTKVLTNRSRIAHFCAA